MWAPISPGNTSHVRFTPVNQSVHWLLNTNPLILLAFTCVILPLYRSISKAHCLFVRWWFGSLPLEGLNLPSGAF